MFDFSEDEWVFMAWRSPELASGVAVVCNALRVRL
jgi:hypothetical protein